MKPTPSKRRSLAHLNDGAADAFQRPVHHDDVPNVMLARGGVWTRHEGSTVVALGRSQVLAPLQVVVRARHGRILVMGAD
jgi:hypothetical protein